MAARDGGFWQGLSARERGTLLLGAAVLLLVLGYALVWSPLAASRATLREQVAQATLDLDWMQRAASTLASGDAAGTQAAARAASQDGRSLLARVDAGAREAGLGDALLRVEPIGPDEVRVAFQGADFDALVRWLEQFGAAHAVTVTELSAQRSAGVGLVDARLALRQGAR